MLPNVIVKIILKKKWFNFRKEWLEENLKIRTEIFPDVILYEDNEYLYIGLTGQRMVELTPGWTAIWVHMVQLRRTRFTRY